MMNYSLFVVTIWTLLLLSNIVNAQTFDNNNNGNINYRLPNTTHPLSYDISLTSRVDLAQFDFSGQVKIKIAIDTDTREIVLHAKQLNVTSIRLGRYTASALMDLPLMAHSFDNVREFLYVKTNGSLLVAGDRLLLDITYAGSLRTDNGGFYRLSYVGNDGALRQVVGYFGVCVRVNDLFLFLVRFC